MSSHVPAASGSSPAMTTPARVVRKGPRLGRPAKPKQPISREAQRVAAAILEVLAGVRTPTDAAATLSLSLPRYYLWEQRALEGLVRACEPRPVGQAVSERHQIAVLEKEVTRLRQDCARHQALVRASQRTIGLVTSPPPSKPAVKPGSRTAAKLPEGGRAKRKRRPAVRALKAVAKLHEATNQGIVADSSSAIVGHVVQPSVPNSSQATAAAASAATALAES